GAVHDLAALGLQLAEQDPQQRGLARAVGADDADPVAAQDRGGRVLEQAARAIAVADAAHLDHLAPGRAALGDLHPHVAGELAPPGTLDAHRLERAHPSLVAGAPGLDALADPRLLLRQQPVEARLLLGLGVQALLAPAQV